MWALGVVLFTMLYGQFPFYDSVPQELFSSELNAPCMVIIFANEVAAHFCFNNLLLRS
jgi:serine/threonine protein kinase